MCICIDCSVQRTVVISCAFNTVCKQLVDSAVCRTIKFLVLDEADKLLSMDFQVAIDKLLEVP